MIKYIIIVSIFATTLYQNTFCQLQGQAKIDSLLKELLNMKEDTNKVLILNDISFLFYSIDPDKGIKLSFETLQLSRKLNWRSGIARSYNTLGILYGFGKSDFNNAIKNYKLALQINEELRDSTNIAANLGNIGIIYKNQSNFPLALDYYLKALKILEAIDSKPGIAINLANLGTIYASLKDYDKALDYFFKALELNELLDNKSRIAIINLNIGSTYSLVNDFEKAEIFFYKSLEQNKELGNLSAISSNLIQLGLLKNNRNHYEEAIDFYNQSLEINKKINNRADLASLKSYLSDVYIKMANDQNIRYSASKSKYLNIAINYLNESNDIYHGLEMLNELSNNYLKLSEAFILQKNYREAYNTYKNYNDLQDSIFSMEKQKEIANLEAKRENELKDAEITILQTEKKAQQFQSYLLAGGVIVLFGAFGIAFLRFREKKKLSDKLAFQNTEIETQKSLLQEKNTEIVDSINYAATIQNAHLPWSSVLSNNFKDHFIIYKPKDIVSGDSYWFQEVDGIKYLAVIDCTGHGVPGSMLTVIANSVLDDAVLSKKLTSTSEILTYMNEKVTEVLNQRLAENSIRDGMEVALIAVHQDRIQFSGAGRPLYVKNGTFETLKTDKRGIARQNDNDIYNYSSVEIEKTDNLILYLSSDGYADQMNENSKKYSTKRFLETLDKISEMQLEKQKEILENEFNSHKGNREQIDDVTVIGVRIMAGELQKL